MPGLEASGAPLHATTLLSTARAEHRGGKSRLARWELLTARVLCLFAGTTGVYPRAYRKGTLTGTAGSSRTTGNRGELPRAFFFATGANIFLFAAGAFLDLRALFGIAGTPLLHQQTATTHARLAPTSHELIMSYPPYP